MTPAKLVASLPESIRVGPHSIAIHAMDSRQAAEGRCYGFFSSIENRISIDGDMATLSRVCDTFLHEVTHAIWWAYGIEVGDCEERVVSIMGTAWTQVYRDNPWLLDWLKKALK
ncbi:hypothetical protein [Microvirga lotononidis]|uniref:SprT-like domain-containing protein n=1 Tax=Microvirga lotononidis TaxID=864069 RepID=I4YP42_9HYPH|nr:hypothetical protein [Microvirga lotononidis]EIM25734.1 hypothetical protein MicloDRAFT_00064610 [Microvirga lotononidis]WQO25666.1 hypothetical protein U0023_13160 [Microvirga lotononidis]